MHKLFETIFDAVFPPSDDVRVVRTLAPADMPLLMRPVWRGDVYALAPFQNAHVRALIHEAKFHDNARAHMLLGAMLNAYLNTAADKYDCIVPVPLARARMRARGYNQVHEVLRHTDPIFHPLVHADLLVRTRDTRPQTELGKTERLSNMSGAFGAAHPTRIVGARILLIDDVVTTGATIRAAKAALLPHKPASVTCLALAY